MKIKWNNKVNAPCCPGEIVGPNGETRLVQTDWDFPKVASAFDWDLTEVQKCNKCGAIIPEAPDFQDHDDYKYKCPACKKKTVGCFHDGTDGTIDCGCGVTASDFITAAGRYLRDKRNNGAEAEDPGYFTQD